MGSSHLSPFVTAYSKSPSGYYWKMVVYLYILIITVSLQETHQANCDLFNSKAYNTAKVFLEASKRGELNLTEDALRQLHKVGQAALEGPERERLSSVMANISLIFTHAELGVKKEGGSTHITDGCRGSQVRGAPFKL